MLHTYDKLSEKIIIDREKNGATIPYTVEYNVVFVLCVTNHFQVIYMKSSKMRVSHWVLLICLYPTLSSAHPGHSETLDLMTGIAHPFSGLDHFLVILLVGFWSAIAFKKPWVGPLAFLSGMILGSFAGLFTATNELLEFSIATSVIITGLLLSTQCKLSQAFSLSLLATFGVLHGLAHTGYLPALNSFNATSILLDITGLLVSTALLHFAGLFCAKRITQFTQIVGKVAGISTLVYGSFLIAQLALN